MKQYQIYKGLLASALLLVSPLLRADMIDDIEQLEGSAKPTKPSKQAPPLALPEKPKDPQPKAPVATPKKEKAERSQKGDKKSASRKPIQLKSDGKSTYTRDGGTIILRKNVVITQDQLRLQADEATVYIDNNAKQDPVSKVEIVGQVKVSKFSDDPSERVVAHCDRAIFINQEQKVKLIGNARLYKGKTLINGKEIVYDIESGLTTVEEAQGVVQPEEVEKSE